MHIIVLTLARYGNLSHIQRSLLPRGECRAAHRDVSGKIVDYFFMMIRCFMIFISYRVSVREIFHIQAKNKQ